MKCRYTLPRAKISSLHHHIMKRRLSVCVCVCVCVRNTFNREYLRRFCTDSKQTWHEPSSLYGNFVQRVSEHDGDQFEPRWARVAGYPYFATFCNAGKTSHLSGARVWRPIVLIFSVSLPLTEIRPLAERWRVRIRGQGHSDLWPKNWKREYLLRFSTDFTETWHIPPRCLPA